QVLPQAIHQPLLRSSEAHAHLLQDSHDPAIVAFLIERISIDKRFDPIRPEHGLRSVPIVLCAYLQLVRTPRHQQPLVPAYGAEALQSLLERTRRVRFVHRLRAQLDDRVVELPDVPLVIVEIARDLHRPVAILQLLDGDAVGSDGIVIELQEIVQTFDDLGSGDIRRARTIDFDRHGNLLVAGLFSHDDDPARPSSAGAGSLSKARSAPFRPQHPSRPSSRLASRSGVTLRRGPPPESRWRAGNYDNRARPRSRPPG